MKYICVSDIQFYFRQLGIASSVVFCCCDVDNALLSLIFLCIDNYRTPSPEICFYIDKSTAVSCDLAMSL